MNRSRRSTTSVRARVAIVLGGMMAAVVAAGCASAVANRSTVLVSVAASLTDDFEQIERDFETDEPTVDVALNIGGSPTLVSQVDEGADVDILVVADEETARSVQAPIRRQQALASNHLVVIHNAGATIETLGDLAAAGPLDDLIVAACDPTVPCGRLTVRALAGAGVVVTIDTEETNVRIVRERVTSGEADVGFVYVTDASDLPPNVEIAPIDLDRYENTAFALQLTDGPAVDDVFDFIVDRYSDGPATSAPATERS